MRKIVFVSIVILAALIISGCTEKPAGTTAPATTTAAPVATTPAAPVATTAAATITSLSADSCKKVLSEKDIASVSATTGQEVVWLYSAVEFPKPICGEIYQKRDTKDKFGRGEFKILIFEKGKQGAGQNVCALQGKEDLSGVGDKACTFKGTSYTEIGFEKGGYYVYLGPSSSTTIFASTAEQTIQLAKIAAGRI